MSTKGGNLHWIVFIRAIMFALILIFPSFLIPEHFWYPTFKCYFVTFDSSWILIYLCTNVCTYLVSGKYLLCHIRLNEYTIFLSCTISCSCCGSYRGFPLSRVRFFLIYLDVIIHSPWYYCPFFGHSRAYNFHPLAIWIMTYKNHRVCLIFRFLWYEKEDNFSNHWKTFLSLCSWVVHPY